MPTPSEPTPRLPPRPVMVGIFLPVVVVLGLVLVADRLTELSVDQTMSDPADVFGTHPLIGAASTVGILVWWAAAVACLFAATLVGRDAPPLLRSFLLWSGLLTAVLVADDQFLVHEDLASRYLGLGQRFVVLAYVAVAALYVVRFRGVLRSFEWLLLALSVALLGTSLAIDYVYERFVYDGSADPLLIVFAEEGSKLAGIAAWSAYYIRASQAAVLRSRERIAAALEDPIPRDPPRPLEATAAPPSARPSWPDAPPAGPASGGSFAPTAAETAPSIAAPRTPDRS